MQKTEDNKLVLTKEEYDQLARKAYLQGALVLGEQLKKVMKENLQAFMNGIEKQFDAIKVQLEAADVNKPTK